MAAPAQPQPGGQNVQLAFAAGFAQVGNEFYVTMQFGVGTLAASISLPVAAARAIAKQIQDSAEKAEHAILKPQSAIATA